MPVRGRARVLSITAALALAGCDSFDFGRVTGAESSSATAARAPAPSASAPALPEAPRKPRHIVLGLGGEIALGGLARPGLTADETHDPLSGLAPVLEDATLVFASLASPLTAATALPGAIPVAPPAVGAALSRARLRVVDATSAELFSSGPAAFTDTLSALARASVHAAGASVTDQASVAVKVAAAGASIAVVAAGRIAPKSTWASAFRGHVSIAEAARLGASVREARAGSDVVIASIGGGAVYVETPNAEDIVLARAAVDAGADVVVLHGAKVPLGIAFVSGHPVLYGLGNLVGDPDPKNPWSGRGFLAKIMLTTGEKPTVDLCPFLLLNGEPKLLDGPSRATQEGIVRRAILRLSSPLGSVTLGDPDLHSCLRVVEGEGAAAAAPSAAP